MAIRFVFHWGSECDLVRLQPNYTGMFQVWPMRSKLIATHEKTKHADATPAVAHCMYTLGRDFPSYVFLSELFLLSRMREDDPTYELSNLFVPTSVQEIHVWNIPGEFLPWDKSHKTRSKLWGKNVPQWFGGIPYRIMLHGSEPTPILEEPVVSKKRKTK